MLSLALIVKNEEKHLRQCLSSVRGVYDELVIVDTGSTDNTIAIAKEFTDKIFHFEWVKDFSAARNFAFSKCSGDWIMWVDADDRLTPKDISTILKVYNENKFNNNIDYFLINYHYCVDIENHKPLATQLRERIIRKTVANWKGKVHEVIHVDFLRSIFVDAAVWHYRDWNDLQLDVNRNIDIIKSEIEENPSDRSYFYYAQEHYDHGCYQTNHDNHYINEALKAYTKAYEITSLIDTKFQSAYKIAKCFSLLGNKEQAISWFIKSIEHSLSYREPLIDLAEIYFHGGEFEKASKWYEFSIKINEPKFPTMVIQKDYYSILPIDRLAKCYFNLKDYTKSQEMCEDLYLRTKNSNILKDIELCKSHKKTLFKTPSKTTRLNLGCGPKTIPGYINCDLFDGPGVDEVFSLNEIPYNDNTIEEIASEHALEHLPRLLAHGALREWYRVLRPGGKVDLKIPDLLACCEKFVSDAANREWYGYTIHGIQDHRDTSYPFKDKVNYGQIHYTGFTIDSITNLMTSIGFIVESVTPYDGFSTPSLHIIANKPCDLNLAIYMPYSYDATNPSVRLRRLNLRDELAKLGVKTDLVRTYEGLEKYDNILFSHFESWTKAEIIRLKNLGKKIYYDTSEALFGLPHQDECFSLADVIVCCSTKLAEMNKMYYPKVVTSVIYDMYEENEYS